MDVSSTNTCTLPKWDELDVLNVEFGPNFYFADMAKFTRNLEDFSTAFKQCSPNFKPAYSVKTNYLPAYIVQAHKMGWLIEVVSGFEFDLVRSYDIPGPDIIFNGPVKHPEEIHSALRAGALLNIDSLQEARDIMAFARDAGAPLCRVAIRCNFGDTLGVESRFGIDVHSAEFTQTLQMLTQDAPSQLRFEGLHVHNCYPGKRPESYESMAKIVLEFIQAHGLSDKLLSLNLGGGFFSPMPLSMAAQFGGTIPSQQDYARAMAPALAPFFEPRLDCALILEPGLIILADTMTFLSRVFAIKSLNGRSEIILSGSVYNVKPTKSRINMPFQVIAPERAPNPLKGRLSGFTCMEDDILHDDIDDDIAVGDYIMFENTGAYSTVLTPPFIRLAPPVLALSESGNYQNPSVVCAAEQTESFLKKFHV